MRPLLFCNHAPPLAALLQNNHVHLDGVEWSPFHTPAQIAAQREIYPGLAFQFHASHVGRVPGSELRLRCYNQICAESGWVSLHLSPIPNWMVSASMKFGLHLPVPDHQWLIDLFIDRILFLQTRLALPVILENMSVLPGLDSSFESDPETISRILLWTDVDFLLDLGHARIAAAYRKQAVRDYLLSLPLERVREIHVSGPRQSENGFYDAHQPLHEEDYQLLAWCLARTEPEMITLEYFREDGPALEEMLVRLWAMIGGNE
jgi:uncharacterized protein (UPF0276 family)